MVKERYTRIYAYSEVDNENGLIVSNNEYRGGVDLPGFIPENMSIEQVNEMLGNSEVEFGVIVDENVKEYILDGLSKLFTGKQSDWSIVGLQIQPGELELRIRNEKIIQITTLARSLDFEDFEDLLTINLTEDFLDSWVSVVVRPALKDSTRRGRLRLTFSNKRVDIAGEVDYFKIDLRKQPSGKESTTVEEYHQLSYARRTTLLTYNGQEDEGGNPIIVGEIEEIR